MNSPFNDFIEVNSEDFISPVTELKLNGPFTDNEQVYTMESVREEETLEEAYPVIEGELSGPQLQRAVDLNEKYKKLYKWENYVLMILSQIGADPAQYPAILSDPKKFAQAFAAWQERNGYKTTLPGVLGINNWTYFQKKLGFHNLSNKHSIDIGKAISDNHYYEKRTWGSEKENIYRYLAENKIVIVPLPLNDEYFAYAIADFQALKGLKVDGTLGPITWASMKTIPLPTPVPSTPTKRSKWHDVISDAKLSDAIPLVDGKDTFAAIITAIRETINEPGEGNFIYIMGWMLDINFNLLTGDIIHPTDSRSPSLKNLLVEADGKGIPIRVLVWPNPSYVNELIVAEREINKLSNAKLFLDKATFGRQFVGALQKNVLSLMGKTLDIIPAPYDGLLKITDPWKKLEAYARLSNEGSHHEKVILISKRGRVTAFCGGVDVNINRIAGIDTKTGESTVLHDIHCQLHDHAAWELWKRFKQRWESNIEFLRANNASFSTKNTDLAFLPPPPADNIASPDASYVKIFHTYNKWDGSIKDRSIKNTLEKVIEKAESSVTFEDQYMVSCEIASWLNKKLRHNKDFKVTIITQDDEFAKGDMQIPKRKRAEFMQVLSDGALTPSNIKVQVLHPHNPKHVHHQIHSKFYRIDNSLVIIGSANCNRRSMQLDSETAAFIFNDQPENSFHSRTLKKMIERENETLLIKYRGNPLMDLDTEIINVVKAYTLIGVAVAPTIRSLLVDRISKLVTLAVNNAWEVIDPNLDGISCKPPGMEKEDFNSEFNAGFTTNEMLENGPFTDKYETGEWAHNESLEEMAMQSEDEHFSEDYHYSSINTEEEQIAEVIEREAAKASMSCEGRTCWAKSVLNNLYGLSLVINNTLDEPTKNAISDFQLKNNLPQTKVIGAATERALLEAEAIQKNKGTASESATVNIIAGAKTKIEDWTTSGLSGVKNKPQHILNSFRDPRKVWAFVLHQMAFKRRGGPSKQYSAPEGYVNTGSHFCIMLDGRIIQLHPMSRMIWHGNCASPRSVAVEFEGNFPNVRGTWWFDRKKYRKSPDEDQPTQAQYDSGRFLASYLKIVLGTTHILAHRQSSDSRENDPGPDIWYNVGQWAIDNLGLTDGGPTFKCGTGNPILPEWRTWGNKTSTLTNKEYADMEDQMGWEEVDLEDSEDYDYNNESMYIEPEMLEESGPENEDFFFESDQLTQNWDNAIRLNRYYQNKHGWAQYYDRINDLLLPFSGQQNVSLGEEDFAQAVAAWQQKLGLSADGVIGPDTWAKMIPFVVSGSVNSPQLPVPVASTPGTGSIPSLGALGKLMINTSVPALSKSYPEYPFTSEDAIWLARFVEGEAGGQDDPDSHAVIWAMFNRFGMLRHRVSSWTSFAVFLQKYSTTLQPLLNSKGAAERVWTNHKSNPAKYPVVSSNDTYPGTSVKKVQYQRHIDLQKKSWTAFPDYVRNMILGILTGQIPNPGIGIATDFDSTYVFLKVARRKQGISGEPSHEEWKQYTIEHAKTKKVIWIGEKANLNQKKNAFYIQSYLKDVPNDAVRIGTNPVSGELMYTENYDGPDYFTDNLTQDLSNAIRQNQAFGNKLGWTQYHDQINDFLLPYSGQQSVSLGEEAFALAVAAWQLQQGLTADGIIGPNTWNKIKPLLNQISQPPAPSVTTGQPVASLQNIFDFNKWHAQKILDSINSGIVGVNSFLRFNPKSQLEMIVKGQQVLKVNPHTDIIQILPFIYHICEQARLNNYTEIIIGSFIRDAKPDSSCTGHCKGRCIDINFRSGNFEKAGAVQMVVNIFNYLLSLPAEFKKDLRFGLPLQGGFFGDKQLTKFKSANFSNLNDIRLKQLIPQLGIVFPDNDNHLHIQCNWMPANGKKMSETDDEFDFEDTMNIEEESMETPAFENFSLSTRLDKIRDWLHLLLFKVPDNIFAGLRWRNMYVQYVHNESYSNDLNADFYRLRIYKYPTVNGILFDAASLLKYIRININSLVDTSYCDFYPYNSTIDTPAWRSDDPIGAVLKLNIKGPDNASVVVSLSKPNGWRFTTVHTPDTGDHPVSGHREFFIGNDSETGGTYFIIKGLDMMSTGIARLGLPFMGSWGFGQADALWKSMRSKVIQFINTNGGYAKEDMTYSERVEWRYVYHRYKDLLAETFGKGAGSAANSSFFDFQLGESNDLSYSP